MIKGFEKETAELNDHERNVLMPIVVGILIKAIGKKQ